MVQFDKKKYETKSCGSTYGKTGQISERNLIECCFVDNVICLHDGKASHQKTVASLNNTVHKLFRMKKENKYILFIEKLHDGKEIHLHSGILG